MPESRIGKDIGSSGRLYGLVRNMLWTPWQLDWIPFGESLRDAFGPELFDANLSRGLETWLHIAFGGSAYLFLTDYCLVSERPLVMHTDGGGRLHCDYGPAVVYADGYDLHAWHGELVGRDLIEDAAWLTPERLESESSNIVLQTCLQKFGIERFLSETGTEVLDEDAFGTLYRKRFRFFDRLAYVRVTNSTPEPDGSFKTYFLRVPPAARTSRQAVAWTFGMSAEDYAPVHQT